ncbi:hypothetical protein APX70_08560 [Pseudomonas syringae pv. maculicola]|uniref:Uncharacterized protein n=1 Tax=Pseudomonas syringae pv. maculicola TaxID=59511 RepID=A0A3M3AA03_PSEYM|nr:hypothetical protein APX70_08560 [Pseudomonas syringae pv. maculicola]
MQNVVAVVRHQDRILFVQVQNLAQRILLLGEQVHAFDVFDQRAAVAFRQCGVRRVRHGAQQGEVQVKHTLHGLIIQRQFLRRQQGDGHQIHRVDRCSFIQMLGHTLAKPVRGFTQPVGAKLRCQLLLAPVRLFAIQKLGQPDGFTEVYRDLAKALFQRAYDFENIEDRLFLLGRAAQLAQVRTALQHALVTDVHGDEHNRHSRVAQKTAQGNGEHAGLRLQHAPGARATAFDKVLDRKPFGEQRVQVFSKNSGVQRAALEGPTHEKRATAPQQAADYRHVQVDARSNVRRREAVAKQQV